MDVIYVTSIAFVYAAFALQLSACLVPKRSIVLLLGGALVLSVFFLVIAHIILQKEKGPLRPLLLSYPQVYLEDEAS